MSTKQFGPTVHSAPPAPSGISAGMLLAERFRIEGAIAEGGMGIVYAARDSRLDRKVAVKVLQDDWARMPDFSQRFEREARAASRINHPNCIVVHDFGTSEHGLYLVMEWIDGRPLAALLAESGALPPERAVALMMQICAGLVAAHAAGIIHRDIKPQNVMVVVPEGGTEMAKLIDFGIARVAAKDAPKLTQAGVSIGSPDFMSPEQALGEECDARSDVYSATAVFYAMLTGKRPYEAETGIDVMHKHLHAPVPSLRGSGPAKERFESIIARGMAKSPGERFPTAEALARAIRETQGDELATRPGAPAVIGVIGGELRSGLGALRKRPRALAGAAVAILAVLGVWGLARLISEPRYPDVEQALAAKDYAKALERAEALATEHPDEPTLKLLEGHALVGLNEPEKARAAYAAAIKEKSRFASDPTLLANAARWLDDDDDAVLAFWRDSIGSSGLPVLRGATTAESHDVRSRAIQLREALKDSQTIDYLAAYSLDVAKPDRCSTRAEGARKLQKLGDKRAIPVLRQARADMGFIDRICAGAAVDEALNALGGSKE